ncbi:glycosyltransferase [Aliarcobacter cryaerophilus]|uniref:glycosyltransferase n=1 Tax=Aliarcobacter cryaerophilus TaxID=28198 RepID=UPI003BB1B3B8
MGDDIRSLIKTIEYSKDKNEDTYANYYGMVNPVYLTKEYDSYKLKIAYICDKYADLIFNAKYDQISYLKSKQFDWVYTYDKNKFFKNDNKFKDIKKIKILHAPSNAIYKGTQLVRAAIKKLEVEGYNFEYVELQNMPNEVVLEHLKSSHIVLNSFYSYVPGLFGIEAMANHCAVLMSADPSIETGLPQDSKDAWLITKYWEVYDNLKYLLDNPDKIKYYADRGYDFAYKHYTYEAASEYINKVLKDNGVIE